jgi:hypothetical protein
MPSETAVPTASASAPVAPAYQAAAPRLRVVPNDAIAPSPNLFSPPSFPQLDLVLTIAMVFIWVAACGLLFYLLTLLLK